MVALPPTQPVVHSHRLMPVAQTGEHDAVQGIVEQLGEATVRIDAYADVYPRM